MQVFYCQPWRNSSLFNTWTAGANDILVICCANECSWIIPGTIVD